MIIISFPSGILLHEDKRANTWCEGKTTYQSDEIQCDVTAYLESNDDTAPTYLTELTLNPSRSSIRSFLEPGRTTELILHDFINTDFAKDRSLSADEITLSIVSPNGYIIAQDIILESSLPTLEQKLIETASMTRQSADIGQTEVSY